MPQESADEEKKAEGVLPPSPISGNSEPNLPPHLRERLQQQDQAGVAKTRLDYDAVEEVVIKTVARKEVIVADQMIILDGEPAKPFIPIDNYEAATPCAAKTDSKERVGFCEKCQWRYYDFTGMEMPQAEELVFKMEGLKKFRLYKRADGKFLTRDCPVGQKEKMAKAAAIGFGSLILILTAFLLMTMPHPPAAPPAPTKVEQKPGQEAESKTAGKDPHSPNAGKEPDKKLYHHTVYRHGKLQEE